MSESTEPKRCGKCKLYKNLSAFHKSKHTRSGVQCYCKMCIEIYFRTQPIRESHKKSCMRHDARYPEKKRARTAVSNAVRDDRLPKASEFECTGCGADAEEYHHHLGYSVVRWLDVIPLCRKCHNAMED